MKKLTLALAFLFAWISAHAATVTVDFSTLTPVAGQTITADVKVNNVFSGIISEFLIGFGFNFVNGNPGVLNFVGATLGPAFVSSGAAGANVAAFTNAIPGLAPGDFIEPLLLATLTFQAVAAGTSTAGASTTVPGNPDHGLFFDGGTTLDINATQLISV